MGGGGRAIPEAELEVLRALWHIGSGTVRDVRAELEREGRRPAYTTVLTLLTRLERKGHVARLRKEGAAHVYRPRTSRRRVAAERLSTLVEQLGEGEAGLLVLELVQAHKLSIDDIRQLRELLDELESDGETIEPNDR